MLNKHVVVAPAVVITALIKLFVKLQYEIAHVSTIFLIPIKIKIGTNNPHQSVEA